MSCECGSNCRCGDDCKCGKKYPDLGLSENTSTMPIIDGVAPVKIGKKDPDLGLSENTSTMPIIAGVAPVKMYNEGSEMSFGAENGCKCGSSCTCDPCKCGK
ncbi:hypothetical protein FH972_011502 [Carpinus fangiana]|uniref:Metallothionein-like protein n=1 Tax=Carpinus fangiana TaxID=176857 RepID=A0A660KTD6_9ROSI|nr:hypothetical protein FH972_011502 [Carpinus fangiana]